MLIPLRMNDKKAWYCHGGNVLAVTLLSLQKQRNEDGAETLSDLDQLYIVHVIQNKGKERWDAGGPILPRLSTALENYPHIVREVEVQTLLLTWRAWVIA